MQGRNEATAPDLGACLRGLTLHSVEVLRLSEGPFAEREIKVVGKVDVILPADPDTGKNKPTLLRASEIFLKRVRTLC